VRAKLEEVINVTILAAALALIWGGIIALAITLIARGSGLVAG
jgi:hypothetical protein